MVVGREGLVGCFGGQGGVGAGERAEEGEWERDDGDVDEEVEEEREEGDGVVGVEEVVEGLVGEDDQRGDFFVYFIGSVYSE